MSASASRLGAATFVAAMLPGMNIDRLGADPGYESVEHCSLENLQGDDRLAAMDVRRACRNVLGGRRIGYSRLARCVRMRMASISP